MKFILQSILIFLISFTFGILFAFYKKIPLFPENTEVFLLSKKYPEISFIESEKLLKLIGRDDILLIDAREREEYLKGHIKGAINIPYTEFYSDPLNFISILDMNKKIIIYCDGGFCELSFKLAELLKEAGFKELTIYTGGFYEWNKKGYPLE
ncbi:MAG: rhodanese-like domain-containing protein [candidate division WOR-3 bacterium]